MRKVVSQYEGRPSARTLMDILSENETERGDQSAYIFRDHRGEEMGLSWRDLWCLASARAGEIHSRVGTGRNLMLVLDPGLDFVVLLFAVMLSGNVPVPMSTRSGVGSRKRIHLICSQGQIDGLIFDAPNAEFISETRCTIGDVNGVAFIPSEILSVSGKTSALPHPAEEAFVQYTSGSTGVPKGLKISHANLLRNLALMASICEAKSGEASVSWLPSHHDFGLIGGILFPAFLGGTGILLAPSSFIRRPKTWLELITNHRAAFTGAPNFGFDLAARRIADKSGLDLSCLRAAINGAERVDPETLRAFDRAFAGVGLAKTAVRPCFGLAEATLLVSGSRSRLWRSTRFSRIGLENGQLRPVAVDEMAGDSVELAANGSPVIDNLMIVADGKKAPDGYIGEVWVADLCVSETADRVQIAGSAAFDGDPAWVATGDLGGMLEGELYIVGRAKELVIRAGANVFLDDVDALVAEIIPDVGTTNVCSFRIAETEDVAILVERRSTSNDEGELRSKILSAFLATFGFTPQAIQFVRTGTIPRTTSGKKQRHACAVILGSGLVDYSQKMTVAARATAAKKAVGQRS